MRGPAPRWAWIAGRGVAHPRALTAEALLEAAEAPTPPGGGPLSFPAPDLSSLGAKGLRHIDRATALLLVTLEGLVPPLVASAPRDRIGLVFGTAAGGLGSIAGFARDAVSPDPLASNPGQFQGTVLNAPLGRAMIRHGLVGPTATFSTGVTAAADAIAYALDAVESGRLDHAVVGGFDGLEDAVIAGAEAAGVARAGGPPLAEAVAGLVVSATPPASPGPRIRIAAVGTACSPRGGPGASARAAAWARRRAGWDGVPVDIAVALGPDAGAALDGCGGAKERLDASAGLGEALGADAALGVLVAAAWMERCRGSARALALVDGCGLGAAIALEIT